MIGINSLFNQMSSTSVFTSHCRRLGMAHIHDSRGLIVFSHREYDCSRQRKRFSKYRVEVSGYEVATGLISPKATISESPFPCLQHTRETQFHSDEKVSNLVSPPQPGKYKR
eukprot:gb/GECG01012783.1/.p1 GENE.gb/GECG01012783.1/~~gb/GECG01012783.1/.p1  ORF type:complete len:112 (+),score=6.85 gb/GECG01012783.1/:1-336(+)